MIQQTEIPEHSKIIIAIDPDVDKSGVAYYNVSNGKIEASSLPFPLLLDYLQWISKQQKEHDCNVSIVVEAGWLNKSTWHGAYQKGVRIASRIGNATGRNHETGKKIIECAKHYGLSVIEQRPLIKRWRGTDGKITHEELCEVMKHYKLQPLLTRCSQDARDAVLISIVHGKDL